ncbi:hypothetical protein HYFRA_00009423, partial [Hymenoscyphus fraxineus]
SSAYITGSQSPIICSENQKEYDFIIVGGGTAGLTLATRLSQKLTQNCFLIIEAGEDGRQDPGIFIPGRRGSTFGSKFDWNLTTVPQTHASNRIVNFPRGRVLGGSSALNLMAWDRGCKADYDAWEDLGNKGWNWKNMYRNMLKVENFTFSPEYGNKGVSKGGFIQTTINRIASPQQLAYAPVMQKLGLKVNRESLSGDNVGISRQPSSIRSEDYTRSYSVEYLKHARENVVLRLSTRVAKVNFDKHLKTTGVTLQDGTFIAASKEVIISAGTFLSPGLLEHSGIGNKTILEKLGITPLYDLPGVGENLHDHPRVQASYILKPGFVSVDRLRFNATYAADQLALYNARLPSEWDYTASAFIYTPWSAIFPSTQAKLLSLARSLITKTSPPNLKKTLDLLTDPSVPQVEVIFTDGLTGTAAYPPPNSSLYGIETFTLVAGLMHPFSRGSVHISSPSITIPPLIDPNYLSSPMDLEAQTQLAKYLREIANTEPLKSVWREEYEPGLRVQSDKDWEDYAKNATMTFSHPVSTCAMGPEKDGGVVSERLEVYGTKALRVVDASVISLLVSGHIQTAVYGIAERAAEIILEDWE